MADQNSHKSKHQPDFVLFTNILNYQPTRSAKISDLRFSEALRYISDFLSGLINKTMKLPSCSKLSLSELEKNTQATKLCMKQAITLLDEIEKQANELKTKQAKSKVNTTTRSQTKHSLHLSPLSRKTAEPNTKNKKKNTNKKTVDEGLQKLYQNTLTKLSTQVLEDLNKHNRVLIPITSHGTDDQNPDNQKNVALLCEFRKKENGEILFLVWNTGIGIDNHASIDHAESDTQYSPVRVFRCANYKSISKENFRAFVNKCLTPALPNISDEESLTPEQYSSHIIGQITFLSGEEIDSTPYYTSTIIPQPDGSSAWKVVETFLKNTALTATQFDEVDYEISKNAFETLLNENEDVIKRFRPLQQEIENIANLFTLKLQDISKKLNFSVERQKTGQQLIQRAQQLVSAPQPAPQIDAQRLSTFLPPVQQQINYRPQKLNHFYKKAVPALTKSTLNEYRIEAIPEIKDLAQANAIMQKLIEKARSSRSISQGATHKKSLEKAETRQPIQVIKQFESLLNALPLTEDFINQQNKIQIHDFALTLQNFVNLYLQMCSKHDGLPHAERQVALYSAIAVLELIANKNLEKRADILENLYSVGYEITLSEVLKANMPNISHPVLKYFNLLEKEEQDKLPARHRVFENSLRSHYLTETNSRTQGRLQEIKDIFKRKDSNVNLSDLLYLDLIVGENQALKKAAGQTGNSKKAKRYTGSYFHRNAKRLASQYPSEYKDTSLCLVYSALKRKIQSHLSRNNSLYSSTYSETTHEKNWDNLQYSVRSSGEIYGHERNSYDYPILDDNQLDKLHPISDEKIKKDFQIYLKDHTKKSTPNNIQIKLHANSIDKKLDLRRILSQIGACPESQIVAAIEYLQSNATNINSEDIQNIVFMLLFDKGLMAREIKENPNAILALLKIIESSLKFYTQDGLKQPFVFYLKLNTFLRKTLTFINKDSGSYKKILTETDKIVELFNNNQIKLQNIKEKSSFETKLLKDLQALKIIELNNQLKLKGVLTQAQLTEVYQLNFSMRYAQDLVNNPFLNKEFDYALHDLKAYAISKPEITTQQVIKDVISKLAVDFSFTEAKFDFPHVTSGDTSIDLINAEIISKNLLSRPLPKEIYQNENFIEFFGNEDIISQRISCGQYTFIFEGEKYRIEGNQYSADALSVIQKKTAQENEPAQWYQLKQTDEEHKNIQNILPSTFINKQHLIWESAQGNIIVIDKIRKNKKLIYSAREKAAYLLNEHGNREKRLLSKTLLEQPNELAFLASFENPNFIEISQDLTTNAIHIRLPRYDLSFTSRVENGNLYYVNDNEPELCLLKSNNAFIEGYDQSIVLANLPHDNGEQKPVKTLIAKFDIDNEDQQAPKATPKQYATFFHTRQEADLEPASTTDAYSLALLHQLFLNKEKGYEILKKYSHMFLGSPQELEAIATITMIGTDEKTTANIPSTTIQATKILACNTIVQYLRQGHTISSMIDSLKNQDPQENGSTLSDSKIDMLCKYLQTFKITAQSSLREYLIIKDFIPKSMRLSRREELAIINFVKKEKPDFYLDIQTKKKELKDLLKEYYNLLKSNTNVTEQTIKRIEIIKTKLLKEYHFTPKSNMLSDKTYDLTKRDTGLPERLEVQDNLTETSSMHDHLKIDDLTLSTSYEKINANYMLLFKEAASDPKKEAQLHKFLNAKLKALIPQSEVQQFNINLDEFDAEQAEELGLPDSLIGLMNTLGEIKLPEVFTPAPQISFFTLLKAMISNKNKVNEIITKYENVHKIKNNLSGHIKIINSVGNSRYINNAREAIEFALSHQSIKFDMPALQESTGKKQDVRFMSKITEKSYVQTKYSDKTSLQNLDTILERIKLKAKLNAKTKNSTERTEKVFSTNTNKSDLFYQSLITESNQDYVKGKADTINTSLLQGQWFKALSPIATRNQLKHEINTVITDHKDAHNALQDTIVTLMNKGPKDPKAQLEWQLALQSKNRKEFTIEDAFKYFSKECLSDIQTKLHLGRNEAERLMQLTQQYLVEGTLQQQYQRILKLIEQLESNELSADNQKSLLSQLGLELSLRRCYDVNKYRDILLFEYLDNKIVFPKQTSILEKLLKQKGDGNYESVAIQLIMGGGKSKVLLPLLAKLRANGTNLTIIEVPGALLETNFYDLQSVSKKLDQKGNLLKFSRNIDADSKYFYRMRQHLRSIVANKEYIVTTRESIQSIELKYIDVLTNPQENLAEWEKQIKYLDDIVNLIQNKGDAIIDEIDLNLRTRDQLIYTVGDGQPTPKYIIESIVALYQSFAHIDHIINDTKVNLHDVVTLKTEKPSDETIKLMLEKLRIHLVNSKQSPIASLLNKLTTSELKEIDGFLANKFTKIPDCIHKMPLKSKSILAVYKEHLNRLLPTSLSRKLYENFGLSHDPKKNDMDKEIAIPYVSNNTPNESAKFQNHLLTKNYTIQTHLAQSISGHIFKTMLTDLKSRLLAEMNLNAYSKQPIHRVENLFKSMIGNDIDLKSLDLSDQEKINILHNKFKDSKKVKEFCLTEYILPHALSNPLTLCSNDQNHVSAYRSTVGFTGTDYNYRCFHDSIRRDNTESLGTDGQTIAHLLRKERQTHILDQNNSKVLFDLLTNHAALEDVRAIIDVGAQFKGISNRQVANKLAQFYAEKPDLDIKYILYFNKDNVLCALKTGHNPEHEEPLVLGSSDNILSKLDCESSQYFSYYDQAHTTGTDIKQAPNTIGIVTVSEKVMLRDLLQAVMRLRDLKDSHHIEFSVMQSLTKEYPTIKKWDAKTILNLCLEYQAKTLVEEHLSAAFNKINNVVRHEVLTQIKTSKNIMDKMILSDAYKEMLYQFDNASYFDKYGMPESTIETENLLKMAQENAITLWKNCLQNAQKKADSKVLSEISNQMNQIIAKSVKICKKHQLSPLQSNCDNQVISQIEVQNQLQNQKENEIEVRDANIKERIYKSWEKIDLATYKINRATHQFGQSISLMSLEEIAKAHKKPRNWEFDGDIHITENFYNTCKSAPTDKINRFKKPLFYVMSIQDGEKLSKVLITQQEAHELREKLKKSTLPKNRQIWIDTPSGIPYAGTQPDSNKKHKDEDRLREQIYFFNADVVYLAANYSSLTWFKENAEDKLNYLEQEFLSLHPSKAVSFSILKEILNQDGKLKPATTDQVSNVLTNKSWKTLHDAYFYPETDKHPAHTKEEYARLKSYTRHRDKVGFFSIRSKFQEFKKAIYSYYIQLRNSLFRKSLNFALQHFKMSWLDIALTKKSQLAIHFALSAIWTVAFAVNWYFALGFGAYLMCGSTATSAIFAARTASRLYAKSYYDSITKIEKISNVSELYALKKGTEAGTYLGYAKGFFSPTCYYYSKAYYAGLEIGCASNEGVLKDEIRRKSIASPAA